MIEIEHNEFGYLTISDRPYAYERHEYYHIIELLKFHWLPTGIVSVRATGKHLEAICEHFTNIAKPKGTPSYGFVWVGGDAQTLVANISLALRNNVSVVVQTVDDYNFD